MYRISKKILFTIFTISTVLNSICEYNKYLNTIEERKKEKD